MMSRHGIGAIVLAGGRASRMGGAAKPLLELDGRSLLHRAVDAVAGCSPVTIVAEVLDATLPGVDWVREDPPFGGPAAGIVAALASWPVEGGPEWAFLLAADLAHPDAAVAALDAASGARGAASDGAHLVDPEGRAQWLAGRYRVDALRAAAARLPAGGRDLPMRALLGGLSLVRVEAPAAASLDIDTWEDLERARAHAVPLEEP